MENLQASEYEGDVYPVCSEGGELGGVGCDRSISEVGKPVELAVIAAGASKVAGLVRECGEHNVSAVV